MKYTFDAKLWLYPGEAAWVFATVPRNYFEDIKRLAASTRGFGAVRVNVTCNGVSWQTSLFPDNKTSTYLLPVKKSVRLITNMQIGDITTFSVVLRDR